MQHLIWVYIVCSGLSIQVFRVIKVYGPASEKRDLRRYANSEDLDQQSGQDVRCSPEYRDLVDDTELTARIMTLHMAAQTGLGLLQLYMQ